MIMIACVDDRNGMMFNHRRQSQDRAVRGRILRMAEGSRLWMSAYSFRQFGDECPAYGVVDEDCLMKAGAGEYCFVEDEELSAPVPGLERIILYRWNRSYPADRSFPEALLAGGWRKTGEEEFEGYSHEKITEEVYEYEKFT